MESREMPRLGGGRMVRSVNRGLVLEVLARGESSRAAIAKETGLNKATVSSQIAELIGAGLVRETGPGESGMGRKPLIVELDPRSGYAFGVDLEVDSLRLIARSVAGVEVFERVLPLGSCAPEAAVEAIGAAVEAALAELPPSRHGAVGLCVAVPGVVDSAGGRVVSAVRLSWRDVALKPLLADRCAVPVVLGNDAKLAAAAEREEAALRGESAEDLLCLLVGEGLGLGAFLAGKPYSGPRGYFGEAGHMTLVHRGRPCPCGNSGCWDAYASRPALASSLASALGLDSLPDTEGIIELGRSGGHAVRACFDEYADCLASGLVSLVNLFSPSAVVLNGEILSALPPVFERLALGLRSRAMPFNRGCSLRLSELGPRAPALGAARAAAAAFLEAATEGLEELGRKS